MSSLDKDIQTKTEKFNTLLEKIEVIINDYLIISRKQSNKKTKCNPTGFVKKKSF